MEKAEERDGGRGGDVEMLLGYAVFAGGLQECVGRLVAMIDGGRRGGFCACLNPHSFEIARRDALFRRALEEADVLVPDGSGIVLASRLLGGGIRRRVTGSDVFTGLSRELDRRGGYSCFFLGSTEETLSRAAGRMAAEYPRVRIAGSYAPPFKVEFDEEDDRRMIEAVREARPDVLWVAMTAPKQEKWVLRNRQDLDAGCVGAVGAALDFFAGTKRRSHPAFRRAGLEWLPRLLREPRRLWRRNLVSSPAFMARALGAAMRGERAVVPGAAEGDEAHRAAREAFLEILFPGGGGGADNAVTDRRVARALWELGRRHNLLPLVADRIGVEAAGLREEWRRGRIVAAALAARTEAAEREAVAALAGGGVPAVVMRGGAIARELYGDRESRVSVDADVLVGRSDVPRAHDTLVAKGYREAGEPLRYSIGRIHHQAYRPPGGGVPLELHWLFGVPGFFRLSSEEIWEGVVKGGGEGEWRLSQETTILMLLIHHHSHSFRQLRILVDLLRAFHRYGETVDWKVFAGRLRRVGLLRTTRTTLDQMEDLWGDRAATMTAVRALEGGLRAMGAGAGAGVAPGLREHFRMRVGGPPPPSLYRDKFFARFLLDGGGTVAASFVRTLVPPPEAIGALYGDRRVLMLPWNYLRFMAWRLRDWVRY